MQDSTRPWRKSKGRIGHGVGNGRIATDTIAIGDAYIGTCCECTGGPGISSGAGYHAISSQVLYRQEISIKGQCECACGGDRIGPAGGDGDA